MHSEKPPLATACGWRCSVSEQLRSRVPASDRFVWSDEVHFRRLRCVANNQRFCVLPRRPAPPMSRPRVLSRALTRWSGDNLARRGHPVMLVETCVDPARHRGTCYLAFGFSLLGPTAGYGRVSGCYGTTAARSSASHAPSGATPSRSCPPVRPSRDRCHTEEDDRCDRLEPPGLWRRRRPPRPAWAHPRPRRQI